MNSYHAIYTRELERKVVDYSGFPTPNDITKDEVDGWDFFIVALGDTTDIQDLAQGQENPVYIHEFLAALNDERVKQDAKEALKDF